LFDYNLIISVSIPSLTVLLGYLVKLKIKKEEDKLNIIKEYQQSHVVITIYSRRFLNIIIDKYCKRGEIQCSINTQQTYENYVLLKYPYTDIDLLKYFQELKDQIMKNRESYISPHSFIKSNKIIQKMIKTSNSSNILLGHIFRKIVYDYNDKEIIDDLYLAEATLMQLEHLNFWIVAHQTVLKNNNPFKKVIQKIRR